MNGTACNAQAVLSAVTPYGRGAGSSRVRVHEWLDRMSDASRTYPYAGLAGAGPATLLRHPVSVARAERRLRALASSGPGRLLLHREASPLSRGALEQRLVRSAHLSVYDFDDALYADVGQGPRYRRIAPKGPKVTEVARAVDRVVAGNETLADWASQHNRDVVVVPSCVDPAAYDAKPTYAISDPPRLGWIGSWSTEAHLVTIAPALLHLHGRFGARLVLVGAPTGRLGELDAMTDRIAWSGDTQRREVARFDLGLMPLTDDPYSRGKCGYKLLQYLAAGVPSVASPVGVNATILARAGLPAADTIDEWVEAITGLLEAAEADRAALGHGARAMIEEHYSFTAWHAKWRSAMFLDG